MGEYWTLSKKVFKLPPGRQASGDDNFNPSYFDSQDVILFYCRLPHGL